MRFNQFDFRWLHPSAAQSAALHIAETHPCDLPPRAVALCICTAEASEWMRSIRWFYANSPEIDPKEIQVALIRMCELLIRMVDTLGWDETNHSWWPLPPDERIELYSLLESTQPFMDVFPQYFSRFTRHGLALIQVLISPTRS